MFAWLCEAVPDRGLSGAYLVFSSSRLLVFSSLIILMAFGVLPVAVAPDAAAGDGTVKALLRLTERAMERQARPLITGRAPAKNEPWVSESTEALRLTPAHGLALARFGRSLRRAGSSHSSINVRLRAVSQRLDGDTLVVRAKKYVRMPYSARAGTKPVVMEQVHDVTLTYRRVGGKWLAVSARTLLHPGAPREPLEDPSFRFPPRKRVAGAARGSTSGDATAGAGVSDSDGVVAAQGLSKTQKSQVSAYAQKWALGHNPAYGDQWDKGDCTNFVSQSVRAGGWSFVGNGSWAQHDEPNMWGFYDMDEPWKLTYTTWTWGGVPNFYQFGRFQSGRLVWTSKVSRLVAGDVLQAKWQEKPVMSHSMIVTKKRGNNVYLSYHTPNTLNKAFTEISKANQGATWYPMHT